VLSVKSEGLGVLTVLFSKIENNEFSSDWKITIPYLGILLFLCVCVGGGGEDVFCGFLAGGCISILGIFLLNNFKQHFRN
jgi:hypothetical protein